MKLRYFELCRKVSKFSDHRYHKMGAVIVRKNRIISVGANLVKTHPRSNNRWRTIHAELNAILGIDYRETKGADLYITRSSRISPYLLSKPCDYCQTIIKSVGIYYVHFVDESNDFNTMDMRL